YATQSKGYRVYNKKTRIIVESIHINFDELKEVMTFDDNTSGLFPQPQMIFDHNSSNLAPQRQHALDYDNSGPTPQLQEVSPPAEKTDTSLQELELLFSPMYEEYFNAGNQSVSKSSALFDNLQQHDTKPTLNVQPTLEPTISPT
ncbi:hypothetical protein Tco_0410487, partial [Tanacetum coccineum]